MEARMQAELLYALRAITRYMTWSAITISLCNFMVIVVAFVEHISKSKNNKKEEKIEKNKRSPKVEDDTYHLSSGHRK